MISNELVSLSDFTLTNLTKEPTADSNIIYFQQSTYFFSRDASCK